MEEAPDEMKGERMLDRNGLSLTAENKIRHYSFDVVVSFKKRHFPPGSWWARDTAITSHLFLCLLNERLWS